MPIEKLTTRRKSRSATKLQGRQFYDEYLGALQFPSGYDVYDKMRRSDYQVARVLNAMMLPIKSGIFEYKPIDPENDEQVKQAKFKNKFFNEWPIDNWTNTLHQMLSYLTFGFAIFEPYYHLVDDKDLGKVWAMKSIGHIRQSTIEKWYVKDGIVEKVHQQTSENEEYIDVDIPGSALVIMTNQKEGDNYEGMSILRPIYGNYIRKDLYLRLDMIGIERMAVGTPILFLPNRYLDDDNELEKFQDILEAYVAHEKSYLILPEAFKAGRDNSKEQANFMIQEGKYDSKAVQDAIQREDTKMMDSVLASFLEIGVHRAGGNSQNEGQMEMFLNSLLSIAEYVGKTRDQLAHNAYIFNFGEPDKRLNSTISNITKNDAAKMMEILRGYAQVDMLRPDERLENEIRADLKLPEKDSSTERIIVAQPDKNTERTPEGEEKPQQKPNKAKTSEK